MGMSASQARLLSLQARMSDVEYEGQQINQQRLVLSNKMNEVMEKMTNMDVPTPPSKQDFLYNKYTGKTKNGKKISAEMNDKGNFDVKKDVAGRIVEDAGLQNITSGSQMRGTEVNIPTKTVDGFHVCQNGEEATAYMSATPASKEDFTEYETKDFRQIYDINNNPKKFGPSDSPYNANNANGKSYATESSSTYIKIPTYTAKQDFKGGIYEGGTYKGRYYGDNESPVIADGDEGTRYRLAGFGDLKASDFNEGSANRPVKGTHQEPDGVDENGNTKYKTVTDYYDISDATEVHAYMLYDSSTGIYTGNNTEFMEQAPAAEKLYADYHFEQGIPETIELKFPLEKTTYDAQIKEKIDYFNNVLAGKVPFEGINEPVGQFVIDDPAGTVTNAFDIEKNSQFKYTAFAGGEDVNSNFENSDKATYTDKSGKVYKGTEIHEHNNDVKKNLNATYYYKDSDGKFKSCKGSDVKDKGYTAYAKVDNGGTPISNIEQDYESVVKEHYYIMDDDNKAQLISANGGIEWAIAQLKAGKKLFSEGTGDVVAYNKDLESDTTVNGCQTMTVSEANGMDIYRNNTAFQDALTGLQQSFPDDWQQFSVIIDNSGSSQSYRFCRTNDLTSVDGQVRVYTPGTGTYQELISNVEPTYDGNGYLEKLILPNGEVVDMEVEQAVDEKEYEKAMNKYNIAKIEYDKEVNELNKQTSIYQRQDKQLELKLTRLDTERNALNTEIDAVKKVIQDATEKGFKTFSG